MKNTLIMPFLLFIAVALSGSLYAQKVKSVEFKSFERLPDDPDKKELTLTKKEIKEFDDKGQLKKQDLYLINPGGELVKNNFLVKEWLEYYYTEEVSTFDEMGEPLLMTKSFYNTKNKLKIKEEYIDYIKLPDQKYTKTYKYTAAGKPESVILTNTEDRKVGDETYKYNSNNEEIFYKKTEIFPDGKKYNEAKKTSYTAEGFLASAEIFIKDGDDDYKEIITFQKNKVKEHLKFKNGEQISSFTGAKAGYDPSKARVLMEFGGGGGSFGGLWSSEDEFDDKGRKIKTTQMEGDEIIQLTTYAYDKNGNLTETKKVSYHDGKETVSSKEVQEYDKQKNVTKKSLYENNKLVSEYTYTYTYF